MMKNKIKKELKIKWCSIITVLTPLLMMYYIGISTLTLLDLVILITYIYLLFTEYIRPTIEWLDKYKKVSLIFSIYILMNFLINIFLQDFSVTDVLFRTLRYLVYLNWPVLVCGKYFDEKFALACYKYVCVFATAFLILQYILLIRFQISLPGYLPFLTLSRPELREYTETLYMNLYARPRSIFAEPSQFGIYITGYLSIMILKEKKKLNKLLFFFLLFGLLISNSTTSYFGIVLSFALVIFNLLHKKKICISHNDRIFFAVGSIVVLTIFFARFNDCVFIINKALVRMPTSFSNRLVGYSLLNDFFKDQTVMSQLLGIGMYVDVLNNITWTSSIVKIVYYFGIIGTLLLTYLLLFGLVKIESKKRILLLIVVVLSFFTELMISSWLVLFLPFIYTCKGTINRKNCMQ